MINPMKIVKNITNTEKLWLNKNLEALISRTWPIKKEQLKRLLWYEIDISSKNILRTNIVDWKADNFWIDFSGSDVYSYKTYPKQKILHNVFLIETYLLLKNKFWWDIYNTFFDGEVSVSINTSVLSEWNIELQPDIAVFRWNTILCIEMDMWTESYEVLKNKQLSYLKFIKKFWDKYKIVILFSSFKNRNEKVKYYDIFKWLDIRFFNLDEYLPYVLGYSKSK